jgi:protein O-GlcNAc transferase
MENGSTSVMTVDQAVAVAAAHFDAGQLAEAHRVCLEILRQVPGAIGAWNTLGLTLAALGHHDEAEAAYRQAVQLAPQFMEAWCNWGLLLRRRGKLGEALACIERAATLAGDHPGVLCNLSTVLLEAGRTREALAAARRGLATNPGFVALHDGLIMILHYDAATTAQDIREELERWQASFGEPLRGAIQPHKNNADPSRRLRVGYISADFGQHSVGRFMAPLLAAHDRQAVEVICYAHVVVPDEMTARLRSLAHGWRSIVGMSDEAVADLIRADDIDVLVDLAMHTAGNRLLIFARKPAPVQVSWLAYPGSTGLRAVDFRLSDDVIDPSGSPDTYVEETLRLETYWCYEPPLEEPVGPLPADRTHGVTFGSLNMSAKISEPALAVWGQLLARVPDSRLLLHASVGGHRERILAALEREAVTRDRVTFVERMPLIQFLRLHADIDIGLDPFPFCGGTTTCDALWMGVPVVTLRGATPVGRSGSSLLTHVGLSELIAETPEDYVRRAAELAGDLDRLRSFRATLRQRLRHSILLDGPRFARCMEGLYRQMWVKWCAERY